MIQTLYPMYNSKYFSEHEFKKIGCRLADMDESFMHTLDTLREKVAEPLVLSSAFRTVERNKAVGGVPNSAHLKGMAVDIVALTSAKRFAIVSAALEIGINRIGIGKSFVHIDTDTTLPQGVIWLY